MNERGQTRLAELQREYSTGEGRLREIMRQEVALRETLLRISGAIQVLEEVLDERRTTAEAGSTTSRLIGQEEENHHAKRHDV